MSHWTRRITLGATLLVVAAGFAGPASAQTKLKWAHVYEIAEPYHTEALWAAEEDWARVTSSSKRKAFSRSWIESVDEINSSISLRTFQGNGAGEASLGNTFPFTLASGDIGGEDFEEKLGEGDD